MSEYEKLVSGARVLPDAKELDIFAKRVLAKKELFTTQEIFQQNLAALTAEEQKLPLKLYVINHNSNPSATPVAGSPVKCLKLCKRLIDIDYPKNLIICTQKSKVILRFQLVTIVEFEDGSFDVLTLPKNLSAIGRFLPGTTKAFVDPTVIDPSGTPITQKQDKKVPYETLAILGTQSVASDYTAFEYTVSIPFTSFDRLLRDCEKQDPSLQSYILLKKLTPEVDILDSQKLINAAPGLNVYTTEINLSIYEDIIDKIGIDQDIKIEGVPEYECT